MPNTPSGHIGLVLRRLAAERKKPHPRRIGNLIGWAVIIGASVAAVVLGWGMS